MIPGQVKRRESLLQFARDLGIAEAFELPATRQSFVQACQKVGTDWSTCSNRQYTDLVAARPDGKMHWSGSGTNLNILQCQKKQTE